MGGLSLPHLIVLAVVVLVLFGRGRISEMMGDFGKGIKSFKQGMNEETERTPAAMPPRIAAQSAPAAEPAPAQPSPPAASPAEPMPFDPVGAPARNDTPRG